MVNDGKRDGNSGTSGSKHTRIPNNGRTSIGSRRAFLKAAGAGTTVTALAGCTFQSDGGDGDGDGDGDGGDGDGDGGDLPDPIKIGVMGPADAPYGASILNSAQLAADEMNNNGGIGGSQVEVSTKDTKDDPSTGRSVYQELTTGEGVHATVGIFSSEVLLAVMPNMADQGKVHLSTGAATPEATRRVKNEYDRFKYYFRVGPFNSTYLGQSLIDFANEQFSSMGWETIGFIIEDYKWTEPISQIVDESFADEVDVEIAYKERISEGTEDFTPIYDTLQNQEVDGAYTVLAHIGVRSLVQWAQQQRPFGYGGIHVPTQLPSFYGETEGAAISTFSQTTATSQSELTDKTIPYANAYQEQFDQYPVYDGYITYDAMYLLKKKIEEAGSVSGDDLVGPLENTSFTGAASPKLEFYGQDHEFPHDAKYGEPFKGLYFQWQPDQEGNGTQQVIWPDDYATSEYQPPPWTQSQ